MKVRKPAVSGKFYPASENKIIELLDRIRNTEIHSIKIKFSEKKIIGGLVPHAGYIYSAYQAVHFFEILKISKQIFDTFIIINPNHTGLGEEISVDENDAWESPLGIVNLDKDLAKQIDFSFNSGAHKHEHSGEVILPMLQHFIDYDFEILPITMSRQNWHNAQLIASKLYLAALKLNKRVCLIASSDFSHFVSPDYGKKQDMKVIKKILNFDSEKIIKTVKKNKISMCGYGTAACLTEFASIATDNPKAELLKFGHSGEIHQSDEVVDYASILVYE